MRKYRLNRRLQIVKKTVLDSILHLKYLEKSIRVKTLMQKFIIGKIFISLLKVVIKDQAFGHTIKRLSPGSTAILFLA